MKLLGGIEPEVVPFFPSPACAAITVYVRLKPPWFPPNVPQELKI